MQDGCAAHIKIEPTKDGCAAHQDIPEPREPSPITLPCTVFSAVLYKLLDGSSIPPQTLHLSSIYLTHNTISGILATWVQQHHIEAYLRLEHIYNRSLRL